MRGVRKAAILRDLGNGLRRLHEQPPAIARPVIPRDLLRRGAEFLLKETLELPRGEGQVIGHVTDTIGKISKEILAPYDGYVFCVNHLPVVNQGDALMHVGR